MKIAFIVMGIIAAGYLFFIWCLCKAASRAEHQEEEWFYPEYIKEDQGDNSEI